MSATLAAIALNAGLPIIEKILSRRLGDQGGELATQVLASIADSLKTTPDQVEDRSPDNVCEFHASSAHQVVAHALVRTVGPLSGL